MNKHTIIAEGSDDQPEMMSAPGHLDVGMPFEFPASGDEKWDRLAGVVIKAAILFLMFLTMAFIALLFYLGLN